MNTAESVLAGAGSRTRRLRFEQRCKESRHRAASTLPGVTTADTPPMATPRVAAGALFRDEAGRVLLVRPTYKDHWDIPGGYVEPGESPRAACIREVQEELGLTPPIGGHLVVDWAPAEGEGDKILFVFDGGVLSEDRQAEISFRDGELSEARFVPASHLHHHVPARLSRRLQMATLAAERGAALYAEHGIEP